MKDEEIKKVVREGYADIAKRETSCCGPVNSCCGNPDVTQDISQKIGYSKEELKAVPEGSNLGLGCGNPVALASLKEGEAVLDLGSGAGLDCFLAANKVGKEGTVIGVDMTPEMIDKARKNSIKANYENVEFRLGEIENIPAADNCVDVVISNCVINLSPDKKRVFKEAFRVLKPGGRLMVSDIVLMKELPDFIRNSTEGYIRCISGAILKDEYLGAMREAGFHNITIKDERFYPIEFLCDDPVAKVVSENRTEPTEKGDECCNSVASMMVEGEKPRKVLAVKEGITG
jgi:SAM-dependent methyltransferase